MGMFDYVVLAEPVPCPFCKRPLVTFQSKDGPCALRTLAPHDVDEFHTICECSAWVEYRRKRPRPHQDWREDFELAPETRRDHAQHFIAEPTNASPAGQPSPAFLCTAVGLDVRRNRSVPCERPADHGGPHQAGDWCWLDEASINRRPPVSSSSGETPAAQDGRTHSESCWTEHHDCARAEIGRLDLSRRIERQRVEERDGQLRGFESECARLRAEVERLTVAFDSYGDHQTLCTRRQYRGGRCDCGYLALVRKFAAAATPPPGDAACG